MMLLGKNIELCFARKLLGSHRTKNGSIIEHVKFILISDNRNKNIEIYDLPIHSVKDSSISAFVAVVQTLFIRRPLSKVSASYLLTTHPSLAKLL